MLWPTNPTPATTGTGFIECADTYAKYQCDVFVHKNEYSRGGCSVGRQVEFSVQMSEKNQPRATSIISVVAVS